MKTFYSVAMHTLEIAVIIFVAYMATHWLNLGGEDIKDILTLCLAALMKLIRALPSIPVSDYVNN